MSKIDGSRLQPSPLINQKNSKLTARRTHELLRAVLSSKEIGSSKSRRDKEELRRCIRTLATTLKASIRAMDEVQIQRLVPSIKKFLARYEPETIIEVYYVEPDSKGAMRLPDDMFDRRRHVAHAFIDAGRPAEAVLHAANTFCRYHVMYIRALADITDQDVEERRLAAQTCQNVIRAARILTEQGYLNEKRRDAIIGSALESKAAYSMLPNYKLAMQELLMEFFAEIGFNGKRGTYTFEHAGCFVTAIAAAHGVLVPLNSARVKRKLTSTENSPLYPKDGEEASV